MHPKGALGHIPQSPAQPDDSSQAERERLSMQCLGLSLTASLSLSLPPMSHWDWAGLWGMWPRAPLGSTWEMTLYWQICSYLLLDCTVKNSENEVTYTLKLLQCCAKVSKSTQRKLVSALQVQTPITSSVCTMHMFYSLTYTVHKKQKQRKLLCTVCPPYIRFVKWVTLLLVAWYKSNIKVMFYIFYTAL